MTKVIVARETLFQLAARVEGAGRGDCGLSGAAALKVREAARQIADATATGESGPLELVVTE